MVMHGSVCTAEMLLVLLFHGPVYRGRKQRAPVLLPVSCTLGESEGPSPWRVSQKQKIDGSLISITSTAREGGRRFPGAHQREGTLSRSCIMTHVEKALYGFVRKTGFIIFTSVVFAIAGRVSRRVGFVQKRHNGDETPMIHSAGIACDTERWETRR